MNVKKYSKRRNYSDWQGRCKRKDFTWWCALCECNKFLDTYHRFPYSYSELNAWATPFRLADDLKPTTQGE